MLLYAYDPFSYSARGLSGLTGNKKSKFHFSIFLKQQVVIVVCVGLIVGALAGLIVAALNHSSELGIVIGLSLLAGILSSLLTGSLMPHLFWKLHSDPAEASRPIATVLQDLLSVVIFFLIAQNTL